MIGEAPGEVLAEEETDLGDFKTKGSNSLTVMAECCNAKSSTKRACCQLLELICFKRVTSQEGCMTLSRDSGGAPTLNLGGASVGEVSVGTLGWSVDTLLCALVSREDIILETNPPCVGCTGCWGGGYRCCKSAKMISSVARLHELDEYSNMLKRIERALSKRKKCLESAESLILDSSSPACPELVVLVVAVKLVL